jgi:hypothetical protein
MAMLIEVLCWWSVVRDDTGRKRVKKKRRGCRGADGPEETICLCTRSGILCGTVDERVEQNTRLLMSLR